MSGIEDSADEGRWTHWKFEIPDPSRPVPDVVRGLGPSGELMPFHPSPVKAQAVLGRSVEELSFHVGTYGMGGYGFFGLRFDDEWLMIALQGASDWMSCRGRSVAGRMENGPLPWRNGADDTLSPVLVGQQVCSLDIQRTQLRIGFSGDFDLTIHEGSALRPLFGGNGKPRCFSETDDLRRAVFLSPTTELWLQPPPPH